jgi:hypothetical protein
MLPGIASSKVTRQMIAGSNWPISVLGSAFGPHLDARKLNMAICVGYLEAHEQDVPGTLTVMGLVSPKPRWQSFEARWPRALRSEGLVSFSARDFIQNTGEFSGTSPGQTERSRLIAALGRVAADCVTLGVSCSLSLSDYRAVTRTLPHPEMFPTPYAVCAGVAMARILRRMARAPSRDVTLFVFEDGGIDHQQVRQIAAAEGVDHGAPVQIWPREWRDEHGRLRRLRPLEACDLLLPACASGLLDRLVGREAWDEECLSRDRLSGIFQTLQAAAAEPVA